MDCQIPTPPVGCSEYAALLHYCKARIDECRKAAQVQSRVVGSAESKKDFDEP